MEKHFKDLVRILKKHGFDLSDATDFLKKFKHEKELKDFLEKIKEHLSQDDLENFFKTLKKVGFLLEQKTNEAIQQGLNKKDLFKKMHHHAKEIAPLIKDLKEWVEAISVPLNFPTKNDVANVAKLTLQNGEKLESIEEQLKRLTQNLENGHSKNCTEKPETKPDEDEEKRLKKQKKLLLLKHILESTNLNRRN